VGKLIGVILIVLGLAGLVVGGITWTDEKTVLDAGPVKVTAEEKNWIAVPPIAGIVSLIGGIVLVGYSVRADRRR
jgi:membrane-bound ClpP family serine protease